MYSREFLVGCATQFSKPRPISDQNMSPFGVAHTCMVYTREYPPAPSLGGPPCHFYSMLHCFGDEMWHFISGADYLYRVLSVGNHCLHLTP